MSLVLACVDGSAYTASVADLAGWAARRLGAQVEVLEVLGRREARHRRGEASDYGLAALGSQVAQELEAVEAERARLLRKHAQLVLEEARFRVESAGVAEVRTLLREGDLIDTVAEREAEADLVVIGKRGEAADFARGHLGSNLERIVRASPRPVLIAARRFRPIRRAVVAFDGRSNVPKALDAISRSPLAQDVTFELVHAGRPTEEARRLQDAALAMLRGGGIEATARIEAGDPATVVGAAVEAGADLLVMGAYGHSRLRSLVLGSVTAELIRACKVPALVYR